MRVSCSLVLLAVFLVLQCEGVPINISTPITVSDSSTPATNTPAVHTLNAAPAVNPATHERPALPLDSHLFSPHLVKPHPVDQMGQKLVPTAAQATAPLSGFGLPSLADASAPAQGILFKRGLAEISAVLVALRNYRGTPFFSKSPADTPKPVTIPVALPLQGLSNSTRAGLNGTSAGLLTGLDSLSSDLQKRGLSIQSSPLVPSKTLSSVHLQENIAGLESTLGLLPDLGAATSLLRRGQISPLSGIINRPIHGAPSTINHAPETRSPRSGSLPTLLRAKLGLDISILPGSKSEGHGGPLLGPGSTLGGLL